MKLKVELIIKDRPRPHFENWEVEDIAAAKKRIAEIEGIVSAVIYDLKTGEITEYKPITMTAEQIVRELAEWSRKYPRGRIYAMSGRDNMDARLIEIEEMAKEYVASSAVQEAEKPAGGEVSNEAGKAEKWSNDADHFKVPELSRYWYIQGRQDEWLQFQQPQEPKPTNMELMEQLIKSQSLEIAFLKQAPSAGVSKAEAELLLRDFNEDLLKPLPSTGEQTNKK